MKLRTKILSFAMAATMLTGVVAGAASTTWVFDGYDLTTAPVYNKVYRELDEKGFPTGRWEYQGAASKIEFKHAFYEAVYPHNEYGVLYLDGIAQKEATPIPTGAVAVSEQNWLPLYWEAKAPYAIFDVMYSRIPGVMDWKVQPYVQYGNRNANVVKSWVPYGVSAYRTINGAFVDTANFLKAEAANKFQYATNYADVMASYEALKALDLTGTGIAAHPAGTEYKWFSTVSNTFATGIVPVVSQEQLVGPKYDGGKEVGKATISALDLMMADAGTGSLYNDALLTVEYKNAEATWVYGGYENAMPHKIYEYLVVDGVVMDGSACLELVYDPCYKGQNWYLAPAKKPLIKRYTGGVAASYLY